MTTRRQILANCKVLFDIWRHLNTGASFGYVTFGPSGPTLPFWPGGPCIPLNEEEAFQLYNKEGLNLSFHWSRTAINYRADVISVTSQSQSFPNYQQPMTCFVLYKFKAVFHFNRIVPKRSVCLYFLSNEVDLMTSTQKKMLRYVTIRYAWSGKRHLGMTCSYL
jgi:hypothetical protein